MQQIFSIFSAFFLVATGISAQGQTVISWAYPHGNPIPDSGTAGVIATTHWNLSGAAGSTALVYNDGSPSPTTLELEGGYGAWGIANAHSPDNDGKYNKAILDGYYNLDTSSAALTISKIPFARYNLYVYFSSDVDGRKGAITDGHTVFSFTTMGLEATAGGNAILTRTTTSEGNPKANYAVFANQTADSKTLVFGTNDGMGFSGIQIVAVPESKAGAKAR